MQSAPFCLISIFGIELFGLSPNLPSLQTLVLPQLLLPEFPDDITRSVTAHPLAIDVDIDINVKASRYMHSHVRRRDRLTEGRGGGDGRKEGDDDLQRLRI